MTGRQSFVNNAEDLHARGVATTTTRRMFLASAAAVTAAGAGTLLMDAEVVGAQSRRRGNAAPLVRELHEQLKAGVKGMRGPRPGEGARAVSATLAMGVAYARSIDLDAEVAAMLRRRGRVALTQDEIDPAFLAAILRDQGITTARPLPVVDLATRERVYDLLAAEGFTSGVERFAAALAKRSVDMDRFNGMIRPVIYYDCQPLMADIGYWGGVVAITCQPWSTATVIGGAACAIASGALGASLVAYAYYCW
jgi:hypothetical protein